MEKASSFDDSRQACKSRLRRSKPIAPNPQPRLRGDICHHIVGIVVGSNPHLQIYRYDHYSLAMRKTASGFWPVIAVDRKAAKPLHKQIYDAYRALIVGRSLHTGQQVPSTRALAAELRISRLPVVTAYTQLLAEGYFEARVGAGTFVCASLPEQMTASLRRVAGSAEVRSGSRPLARRTMLLPPYETFPWVRGYGAFSVSQPAFDQL